MKNFYAPGSDVDPIKSRHNWKVTNATIKNLLADGVPNWIKFPNDYKNFVRESFAAEKEISDNMVSGYKMVNQELLMNARARKVNAIGTRDFIAKLRRNGVKCFTVDNGFPPQTIALWAVKPGTDKVEYICYLQVPAMYEWSVLKVDRHGLPAGEDFRGWRTVLVQLITKGILIEAKAHQIFGRPTDGEVSMIYRESLYFIRNHAELDAGPQDYQF
jgi:hypothetical protein